MYLHEKIGKNLFDSLLFESTKYDFEDLKEFESKIEKIFVKKDIEGIKNLYKTVYNKIKDDKKQVELKELCEAIISDIELGYVDFDISLMFNVWDDLRNFFAGIELQNEVLLGKEEFEVLEVYNSFPLNFAYNDDDFNFIFAFKETEKFNSRKTITIYELIE